MPDYSMYHTGEELDETITDVLEAKNNGGITPLNALLDLIYPVGSIYMSVNATSPSTLFGGTWVALQGRFLVGANSTYTGGSTGGSATMAHTHTLAHTHTTPATTTGSTTLTVSQIPSHRHDEILLNGDSSYYLGGGNWNSNARSRHPIFTSGLTATTTSFQFASSYTGGGEGHTHPQVATTTSAASTSTTSAASNTDNLPPYLAVYMWKRTA